MIFGILTLLTALSISAVAIYYSVAGLVAIFAASPVSIMVMGGVLEVSKLVTAVWLHRYWSRTRWWLRTYLSTAVIVLMFITSMGIFGFLSKAHIEQTASAQEGIAQIERINDEITREQDIIARAELRIEETVNSGSNRDSELQQQITLEQARIDSAYERIQPAIDEQNAIIARAERQQNERIAPLQSEVDRITQLLNDLQTAINSDDIERAQGIVGTPVDGQYGPNTAEAIENFRSSQTQRRDSLIQQIDNIRSQASSAAADAAREEIKRLRSIAEEQIAASGSLLERLRAQLGQSNAEDVQQTVEDQRNRISQANITINELTEQRYELESEYRKLEAEVGPIKYIAEFIYGETDQSLLEESVRWVIILIIFVFDPLAVLLLIASQYTFEYYRQDNPKKKIVKVEPEPEPEPEEPTFEEIRKKEYEEKEKNLQFLSDKEAWKKDHPRDTLKAYKNLFIQGKIDSLPWEGYSEKDN